MAWNDPLLPGMLLTEEDAAFMALKLSREQLAMRDAIVLRLRTTGNDLDDAIATFNEALEAARLAVQPHVDAYGEALEAARVFANKIAHDMQEEIDGRSERWQVSDKGQAAIALQEAWDSLDLESVDLGIPDDVDALDLDTADALADAPTEPE